MPDLSQFGHEVLAPSRLDHEVPVLLQLGRPRPVVPDRDGLSREGFRIAHDISAYSFPAMAKAALPMLNDKSALVTLTYLGAEKVVPNYNTMGLAKASLEASVRYLASSPDSAAAETTGRRSPTRSPSNSTTPTRRWR